MKNQFISVMLVCFCFYSISCASVPDADFSVYIPKKFEDVVGGKFYMIESYRPKIGFKVNSINNIEPYDEFDCRDRWSNFTSEVYIKGQFIPDRYTGGGHYEFTLYDEKGNEKIAFSSYIEPSHSNVSNVYNIGTNTDFDPNKKYNVNYRIRYTVGYFNRLYEDRIYVDSIDGLLTSEELKEKDRQSKIAQKEEYELRVKTEFEAAYQQALSQNGVSGLAAFILGSRKSGFDWYKHEWDDTVIEECRSEIAKRLTNNQNITFVKISRIGNPYAFDKNAIYYYQDSIKVNQWRTDGSLLCLLGDDVLIIEKVPDITKIGSFIGNAYLRYKGTREVTFVNGSNEMIAVFDLLFYF